MKSTKSLLAALAVCIVSISILSASPSATDSSAQALATSKPFPLSKLSKPTIAQVFSANRLTVSGISVKKPTKVFYQWIRDGIDVPGEISKSYEWTVPDCPQNVQVRVSVKQKGKKATSSVSESFNTETCFFSTGDLPAWGILHECGAKGDQTIPSCAEYTSSTPGAFRGFVYRREENLTWFRVALPGIDPSRVISWQAHAKGIRRTWALSLVMISKNEPSWACCDWKGTKFPPEGIRGSQISDEVMGISPDGGAYVGFNYYDKYRVSELFILESIEILVKYR